MTLRMEAGARGKTYKIGQAATLLDVKPFVLRFWETEFKDVLVPVRTPSGQRAYTEANVEMVREIKRLLYDEGLTIEGAKKRLHQGKGQPSSQSSDHASGQTPPQTLLAPAPPAQPGHSIESQHFEAQPPLPGLARPEPSEVAQQASALAGTLADVYQELKAIRDLLT
jgi:DNA-binding transcriptional MerR regulator